MAITNEKIKQALLAFDRDGDGRVLPNELILSQLSLGVYLKPDDRIKFDDKATGIMDYDKATNLIQGVSNGHKPAEEMAAMFSHFDVKKDGTISAAELKAVLQNLGEVLSEPQIEHITQKFSQGDRLNYKSLIAYLLE